MSGCCSKNAIDLGGIIGNCQKITPPYPLPCSNPYIIEVDTRLTSTGSSNNDQIIFPLSQLNAFTGSIIDWGDGTSDAYAPGPGGNKTHTYAAPGVYRIYCCGVWINRWNATPDRGKLTKVIRWGGETWQSFSSMFRTCINLQNINTPDIPILAFAANMDFMFDGTFCTVNAENWDVSGVFRMEAMFRNNPNFNNNISNWNTSSLQDLDRAFQNATSFNRDLSLWNVSNIQPPPVGSMTQFLDGKDSTNFNPLFLANMYAAWAAQPVTPNVVAGFGNIQYIGAIGAAGKAILQAAPNNWTITDGGAI
jgi:surface protein